MGTQIQVPKKVSEERLGAQIQAPETVSEERAGTQIQAIGVVTSPPPAVSSSCPSSVALRDIDSLASSIIADLDAIFYIGPQGQVDHVAVVTSQ